jgi:hypothetical protein
MPQGNLSMMQGGKKGGGGGPVPGLIPVPGTPGFPLVVAVIIELGILAFLRGKTGRKRNGG